MATGVEPVHKIYTIAGLCESSFGDLLSVLSSEEHRQIAQECQQRFARWATYLGVFANPQASLDSRLKLNPDLHIQVVRLLDTIERNLRYGLKFERDRAAQQDNRTSPTDKHIKKQLEASALVTSPATKAALDGVRGALDILHRLGSAIRKNSTSSLTSRIKSFSRKSEHEHVFFERMALLVVTGLYPDITEAFATQLARSISFRRQRLLYQRNHQKKLSAPRPRQERPAELPSPCEALRSTHQITPRPQPTIGSSSQVDALATSMSLTNPSALDNPISRPVAIERVEVACPPTVTSVAQNNPYPRPPEVLDGRYCQCDWCFKELEVPEDKIQWKHDWISHFKEDLEPYACISEECSAQPPYFVSLRSWREHMDDVHTKDWTQEIHKHVVWYCDLDQHDYAEFSNPSKLRRHLLEAHQNRFTPAEQDTIVRRNVLSASRGPTICPLCGQDVLSLEEQSDSRWQKSPFEKFSPHSNLPRQPNRKTRFQMPEDHVNSDDEDGPIFDGVGLPSTSKAHTSEDEDQSIPNHIKLTTHVAAHLKSLSFMSLRYFDDDNCVSVKTQVAALGVEGEEMPSQDDDHYFDLDGSLNFDDIPLDERHLGDEAEDEDESDEVKAGIAPLSPDEFTIAWMCANKVEYSSSKNALDRSCGRKEYPHFDIEGDQYTLGEVGNHYVVILLYNKNNLPNDIRKLLHDFPNIKLGMIIGTGSAVPSLYHDIRLGDVVVSAARDGKASVVQYQTETTPKKQNLQTERLLDLPPAGPLRAAIEALQSQAGGERDGSRLLEIEMGGKVKRPDPWADTLYQSKLAHTSSSDNHSSSTESYGDGPSGLALHPERSTDDGNCPAIHYGLIASASHSMNDSHLRDQLARTKDILCFEADAAGLIPRFSCVVIRGICDYVGSQANQGSWRNYAAVAAATYAKVLLYQISPGDVEAEARIVDGLGGSYENPTGPSKQQDTERIAILDMLQSVDFARQQDGYRQDRAPGTGRWLVESAEFKTWVNGEKQILFCPGIPGAGKTFITSIVIDDLEKNFGNDGTVGIAYYYCSFLGTNSSAEDVFESLLKQLAQRQTILPDSVKSLYENHEHGTRRPSDAKIIQTLHSVIAIYSKVFIIVDGLDEVWASEGAISKLRSEFFSLQDHYAVNLFVTSRFVPDVEKHFKNSPRLDINATEEDILAYLAKSMSLLPPSLRSDRQLQEDIRTKVLDDFDSMFSLAQLYVDIISKEETENDARYVLQRLPQGSGLYDSIYKSHMARLTAQGEVQGKFSSLILPWLLCARRPLTVKELRAALAPEIAGSNKFEHAISSLAGLATIDVNGIIAFTHYAIKECFRYTQSDQFPNAESDVTKRCIEYLSLTDFDVGFCLSDKEFERRLEDNDFYGYAARNWGHHARNAPSSTQEVMEFLKRHAHVEASSQALMAFKRSAYHPNYSQGVTKPMTGLHLAAYFGIADAIQLLLDTGFNVNVSNSHRRTPLSYASDGGWQGVVKILLNNGAYVDSRDNSGRIPLSYAAARGHRAVVEILLDAGADVSSMDNAGRVPLSFAAQKGSQAVVRILLSEGANVNSPDVFGQTPLSYAIKNGHRNLVPLLDGGGELRREGRGLQIKSSSLRE
ncbi:Fc.00g084650.m01.CDS01 [Cosmosporella sp. VM-42]